MESDDDATLPVLLLVKRSGRSTDVRQPEHEGERGARWWAEFADPDQKLDSPAIQLALLLPDGRRIGLPKPRAGGRRPSPAVMAIAAAAALAIGGWLALDGAGVDPARQSPVPPGGADGASQRPRPVHRTPAQVFARTPKGMSLVVHAISRSVALYRSPRATTTRRMLPGRNAVNVRTTFLVKGAAGMRFKVALPIRPNGSTAWVRAVDVRPTLVRHRVNVDLTQRRLSLYRDGKLVERFPIGVGKAVTPTPTGVYYIIALLKQPDPNGPFGPYAFALSGHSPVLDTFAGGNGRIGIHGTNEPWAIGTDVSHGCIRVNNDVIRRLARALPLGTPVRILRS